MLVCSYFVLFIIILEVLFYSPWIFHLFFSIEAVSDFYASLPMDRFATRKKANLQINHPFLHYYCQKSKPTEGILQSASEKTIKREKHLWTKHQEGIYLIDGEEPNLQTGERVCRDCEHRRKGEVKFWRYSASQWRGAKNTQMESVNGAYKETEP